jgi:hypothetical protein
MPGRRALWALREIETQGLTFVIPLSCGTHSYESRPRLDRKEPAVTVDDALGQRGAAHFRGLVESKQRKGPSLYQV